MAKRLVISSQHGKAKRIHPSNRTHCFFSSSSRRLSCHNLHTETSRWTDEPMNRWTLQKSRKPMKSNESASGHFWHFWHANLLSMPWILFARGKAVRVYRVYPWITLGAQRWSIGASFIAGFTRCKRTTCTRCPWTGPYLKLSENLQGFCTLQLQLCIFMLKDLSFCFDMFSLHQNLRFGDSEKSLLKPNRQLWLKEVSEKKKWGPAKGSPPI